VTEQPIRTISTGQPSTLRTYRQIAQVIGPRAVEFIDEKARQSPNGLDEEVMADERQMLVLLASFIGEEPNGNPER
jgi:hypothetical protein